MQWTTPFENEAAAESFFFSTLNTIAKKHGCVIENVDMERNIINLSGPTEGQESCAIEIAEKLKDFLQ